MIANAEDAGYKLLDRADLYSSEHGIGGIRGTKDALKWAFEAKSRLKFLVCTNVARATVC